MKSRVYGFTFVYKMRSPSDCLSNVSPKYLTTGIAGIMLLLNETGGQSPDLSEKVIKDD